MKKKQKDYVMECFYCGSVKKITLSPHRKNKRLVGLIFLCTTCESVMRKALVPILKGNKRQDPQ